MSSKSSNAVKAVSKLKDLEKEANALQKVATKAKAKADKVWNQIVAQKAKIAKLQAAKAPATVDQDTPGRGAAEDAIVSTQSAPAA